jgi:transcriptional regulator with XRE-family HTH domain
MASSTDESRGPTNEQVGRKLTALRQVMGFDLASLAERSRVDAAIIASIEAGTHSATFQELSDLAFALGVTRTSLVRPTGPLA